MAVPPRAFLDLKTGRETSWSPRLDRKGVASARRITAVASGFGGYPRRVVANGTVEFIGKLTPLDGSPRANRGVMGAVSDMLKSLLNDARADTAGDFSWIAISMPHEANGRVARMGLKRPDVC